MTLAEGRDPAALRIIKIVYSNTSLDDLRRYRDAGVTEFNIASSGEIPQDEAGMQDKLNELGDRLIRPPRCYLIRLPQSLERGFPHR
jgi:hypothetical protein